MAMSKGLNPMWVEAITITTDGSGNASVASSHNLNGEIFKIWYNKGTVNANTTAVTTITATGEQVDSKDVNTATNQTVYPMLPSSTTNRYVADGTLTVTVTGGATNKTFSVTVYYR